MGGIRRLKFLKERGGESRLIELMEGKERHEATGAERSLKGRPGAREGLLER